MKSEPDECSIDDVLKARGGKTPWSGVRNYQARNFMKDRMRVGDGEREALMQAVAYLDAKMSEIRKAGKVTGAERIAVMAALNVAHELLSLKLGPGLDVGLAKRRMAAIESQLDAAIAKQEKLF